MSFEPEASLARGCLLCGPDFANALPSGTSSSLSLILIKFLTGIESWLSLQAMLQEEEEEEFNHLRGTEGNYRPSSNCEVASKQLYSRERIGSQL